MPKSIFEGTSALLDQLVDLSEDPASVVGMEMFDPELSIVAHLPRCISHYIIQILADEGAGKITRNLSRIDNRGTRTDERL